MLAVLFLLRGWEHTGPCCLSMVTYVPYSPLVPEKRYHIFNSSLSQYAVHRIDLMNSVELQIDLFFFYSIY